ncbi:hydroxyproline dehydrogenase-like [Ptychodera flava]|uniref:hydroxyproline dehydrogenase-like n=1 Tax=Ptychodera flava TaxID=63121 RepID=UPI00396A3401
MRAAATVRSLFRGSYTANALCYGRIVSGSRLFSSKVAGGVTYTFPDGHPSGSKDGQLGGTLESLDKFKLPPDGYSESSRAEAKRNLQTQLDFGDASKAFKAKSTGEIFRAIVVLKVCSYEFMVNNATKLMWLSQRFLGKTLSDKLLKSTFYGQFVAGETTADVKTRCEKLRESGILSEIAIPLEEDVGEASEGDRDSIYEQNINIMIKCVDQTLVISDRSKPLFMQVRISPLVPPDILVKIGQMVEQGNYNCDESDPLSIQSFARGLQQNGKMNILIPGLNDEENEYLNKCLQQLDKMAQYAVDNDVKVLVDAEYTYLNPAMTLITLALMYKYNRLQPYFFNTYQSYLKASQKNISGDIAAAQKLGFCFGVKLVRGAYLDTERARAKNLGYEDPINDTYEDTSTCYNANLETMLDNIHRHGNRFNIFVASHNEESVTLAIEQMRKYGIGPEDGKVFFAQLLGMCDQVSYALGQAGYLVYKSLPMGPVQDVIPYLHRRASENRSVLAGARREQELLWGEFKRRMKVA